MYCLKNYVTGPECKFVETGSGMPKRISVTPEIITSVFQVSRKFTKYEILRHHLKLFFYIHLNCHITPRISYMNDLATTMDIDINVGILPSDTLSVGFLHSNSLTLSKHGKYHPAETYNIPAVNYHRCTTTVVMPHTPSQR